MLERALDVRFADQGVADAQAAVQKTQTIQTALHLVSTECTNLTRHRSAMVLPQLTMVAPMRRLATDLAAARGALGVGFVVTINPMRRLDLQVEKDGHPIESASVDTVLELEATREVNVRISEIATMHVRGGRRDVQDRVRSLEERWSLEVAPHLTAAAVTNLEGLEAKLAEAMELDAQIKAKENELRSIRSQLEPLVKSAEALELATIRAKTYREALGDVPLETLIADLDSLGADPLQGLRNQRAKASKNAEVERTSAAEAANQCTVAQERAANLRQALDAAVGKRDDALTSFPDGLNASLAKAQGSLAEALAAKEKIAGELASLDNTLARRKERIDTAASNARKQVGDAKTVLNLATQRLSEALESRAEHAGRLSELQKQWDAEDPQAADRAFREATARYESLPAPGRDVDAREIASTKEEQSRSSLQLDSYEREIQRAHGALEQVGGAVARERLRDAAEALELAERHERETEADYEAWKLLLEQMKEADSAQASNLGQALAPAIATVFETLTQRRYESVKLTAQLGTEGVVLGGIARPPDRLSVGTREQLSTLYRLSLAEYLRATVVLDDQLVQSDDTRMHWFRSLLTEKAHAFQIIVFTCRPSDYLTTSSMVPDGSAVHADTYEGFIRAIDLGRLFGQRSKPQGMVRNGKDGNS